MFPVHAVLNEKKHIIFVDDPVLVYDWVVRNRKHIPDEYSVLVEESRHVYPVKEYLELMTPVRPAKNPEDWLKAETKPVLDEELALAKELALREILSSMTCVQAGWAFGVPEDGRDQWLDLVVKAVMEKYS